MCIISVLLCFWKRNNCWGQRHLHAACVIFNKAPWIILTSRMLQHWSFWLASGAEEPENFRTVGALQVGSWNQAILNRLDWCVWGHFSVALLFFLLCDEPSQSQSGSGWRGGASCGHLRRNTSRTQRSVAGRDGMRPVALPHSMEFSWRTNDVTW